MKEFTRIQFDPAKCRQELAAFRALLDSKEELEEGADIKPFFEAHLQLSAFIGTYSWHITRFDLLAFQYQLFGDFGCDLVVGDSSSRAFGFIEWEDAGAASLFRQQGKKATPEWSSRLERGFSQIVDWLWKLDDMARTDDFETRFGGRHVHYFAMLVIGRDAWLSHPREKLRWQWRADKVLVSSLAVPCLTYDQLYDLLAGKLNSIYPRTGQVIAKEESGPSQPEPGSEA